MNYPALFDSLQLTVTYHHEKEAGIEITLRETYLLRSVPCPGRSRVRSEQRNIASKT